MQVNRPRVELIIMTMMIDEFEPVQIEALLKQSVEVIRTSLNHSGFADYVWTTFDNQTEQVERKQTPEILSKLEEVEYQLLGHLQKCKQTILLIEGVAE